MKKCAHGATRQLLLPAEEFDRASDAVVIAAISRGSAQAFAVLFDRTADAVRAELAADFLGSARGRELLASSYIEVWWLAGCHIESEPDVMDWILTVVRRRIAAARSDPARHAIVNRRLEKTEHLRPSHAELELAALLRRPVDRVVPEMT